MSDPTVIEGLPTRLKVGLEIHVELATRTKMWTAAPNVAHPENFQASPNSLVDAVVLALPGTLPVMNKKAVEMSIRVGLALNCRIASFCKWDRKSYYYPDLPKNYQISQYDQPLCAEGWLDIPESEAPGAPLKRIRIRRAHLEEDAGKLLHEAPGGFAIDHSIIDLNRAGTPLLEIVTEPDFETAEQAVIFSQRLRDICRALGVTAGILQQGHMRFEPNINVLIEKGGRTHATPVAEVKNLNSFRAVRGSIEYEHIRQVRQWLSDGREMGPGAKSTLGWDDARNVTTLQREKEDAHDYRYFPDPDLLPLEVSEEWVEELRHTIPELPHEKKARYLGEFGLNPKQAESLLDEPAVTAFFEEILAAGVAPKRAAALVLNNLAKRANESGCLASELGIRPRQIAAVESLLAENKVSSNAADELLGLCCADPSADPAALAESRGLLQVSDSGALDAWVEAAIAAEPKAADDVRAGKMAAIGRLVGAVMKLSGGQANPKSIQEKLRQKLAGN